MKTAAPDSLWRHSEFLKLWCGQSISALGSEITLLALSLTAIRLLNATPVQMGILAAVEFAPYLLFGIIAGVWVDRMRRKPILITTDAGRFILLALIPLIALEGLLRIEYLYVIAFLIGTLTVFFDVAYVAYLPTLVSRDQLIAANSRLDFSQSITKIAGPGLGGALVQVLTAPIAIIVDALSFLISALSLMLIRTPEPAPAPPDQQRSFREDIREGVQIVFANPFLRIIAGSTAINALFLTAQGAIFILYMTRELGIEPAVLGVLFSVGSLGSVLGALVAGRLSTRLGIGPTIILAHVLFAVAILMLPLIRGSLIVVVPLLVVSNFLFGLAMVVKGITVVSLRQAITPDRLQGRVTASIRFLTYCAIPLGSLLGGVLGGSLGLRPTLLVSGLGSLSVALWLVMSSLRHVREQPGMITDSTPQFH